MFFDRLLKLTSLKSRLLNATSFSQLYSQEKLPLSKFRREGAMLSPLIAGLLAACGGGGGGAVPIGGGGGARPRGEGEDELRGQAGNDALIGGEGRDKLIGGDGDDWLIGGSWADTLYGGNLGAGSGSDRFVFTLSEWGGQSRPDIIADFGSDDRLVFDLDSAPKNDVVFREVTGLTWQIKHHSDNQRLSENNPSLSDNVFSLNGREVLVLEDFSGLDFATHFEFI